MLVDTRGAAIGGLRCRTVSPCDCPHVALPDGAGRGCGPTSLRSVAGQDNAAAEGAVEEQKTRDAGGRSSMKQMGVRLPLTTINGACGLALCVKDLARRAHLRLSARIGGGRVQSIGGAVCGRGSGHGGDRRRAGELVGGPGFVVVGGRSDLRGGKGDQLAGESSAGHSMGRRVLEEAHRDCRRTARRLGADVIGGCAKSSQTLECECTAKVDRQVETTRVEAEASELGEESVV